MPLLILYNISEQKSIQITKKLIIFICSAAESASSLRPELHTKMGKAVVERNIVSMHKLRQKFCALGIKTKKFANLQQ